MSEHRKNKAAPQLLREDLRKLPSELVTIKEIEPEDKIHPLDPPHIQEALIEEYQQKQAAPQPENPEAKLEKLPGGPLAKVGERRQLNQRDVDYVRIRVLSVLLGNIQKCNELGLDPDFGVRHIWFPQDEVNIYEVRPGNPPHHFDRPRHMRNLRLWVDPKKPDQSMVDLAKEVGVDIAYDLAKRQFRERIYWA